MEASNDTVLLPWQILKITNEELGKSNWIKNCTEDYINLVREYIQKNVADRLVALRKQVGMQEGIAEPNEEYEDVDIDADVDGMLDERLRYTPHFAIRKCLSRWYIKPCVGYRCNQESCE